ncbi:MAG: methionyl-tRNA formyltransferase [Hydrogenophilales bacterium CG_4_9_14_3_um_filter_63_34]|nr:MAG: methionyl-tRNA formyltransferase [Hydrogenophilales bacterium CG_4_10_14_3_um_filter_63_21]PJB07515.1 MAG: methionyl-tRNA formyltransferase [Hydrogenophilales bacterium CG_4_9_14_3_um_filter_63_34]
MRLIFAGTPEFAAAALKALIAAGHEISLVLTQPDRPAGRGMKLKASPVKAVALAHGLTVAQPENLKSEAARQPLLAAGAEAMVVAAYGLILPEAALAMPRLGCVNIHASLLPRWRGAAPIHRAIEAGDRETGITLMRMDKGLDTGAMLTRAALPILDSDTTGSLHDKLAELGAREIVALLPRLETMAGEKQDDTLATYAKKIARNDARLDWSRPAEELDRRIRAFNPFPGAHALFANESIKVWRARPVMDAGQPGTVLSVSKEGLRVACGSGALDILEVQKPGGKRLAIAAFLTGGSIKPGDRLL